MAFFRFLLSCTIASTLLLSPAFAEETSQTGKMQEQAKHEKAELLTFKNTDHVLGDKNAKVKIIEYASLSCSHCAHFHAETFPKLKEKYIDTGKMAFAFRHFPLNEPAVRGAMLADCSGDKYYTFLKVLFRAQDKWAFSDKFQDSLRTLASVGGISGESFDKCMADKTLESRIFSEMQQASKELSITSTPTLFLNGEKIEGFQKFEELSARIDPLVK